MTFEAAQGWGFPAAINHYAGAIINQPMQLKQRIDACTNPHIVGLNPAQV